jgi:hypothetical protein
MGIGHLNLALRRRDAAVGKVAMRGFRGVSAVAAMQQINNT